MDEYIPDEKVRILQDNLVFVNALPSDTSTKEVKPYPLRPYKKISTLEGMASSINSYSTLHIPTKKDAPTKPMSPMAQSSMLLLPSSYPLPYLVPRRI